MGWWKCAPDGGIDTDTKPTGTQGSLLNAIPARDSAEDHYMGDTPADIMGEALRDIAYAYQDEWGRWPYIEELRACLNFSLASAAEVGQFIPEDAIDDPTETE